VDSLPDIWKEFLFIVGEEAYWKAVNGQLNGCKGEDKSAPGVFAYRERLVEGPGEGIEVWGI